MFFNHLFIISLFIQSSSSCHHKSPCCPAPTPSCGGGCGGGSGGGNGGGSKGGSSGSSDTYTFSGNGGGGGYSGGAAPISPEAKGYPSISALTGPTNDYDYEPSGAGGTSYPGPAPPQPAAYQQETGSVSQAAYAPAPSPGSHIPMSPAPAPPIRGDLSGMSLVPVQDESKYKPAPAPGPGSHIPMAPAPAPPHSALAAPTVAMSGTSVVPVQLEAQLTEPMIAKSFKLIPKPGHDVISQFDPSSFDIENFDLVPLNEEDKAFAASIKKQVKGAKITTANANIVHAQTAQVGMTPQLITADQIPGLEKSLAQAHSNPPQEHLQNSASGWTSNTAPAQIETQNSVNNNEISTNRVINSISASGQECNSITCNFESTDLCNYSNLEEEGSEMLERWEVAEGRFQNTVTGVPKSDGGNYYLAAYVGNGDIAAIVANVDLKETRKIQFNYFEASEGISLRVCCSTLTFCDFETAVTNIVDDRIWKSGAINCPGGTDKVYFLCESALGNDGTCAIDDITLRSPITSSDVCSRRKRLL